MPKLNDKSPMPYGKFKNVPMANIPADYLIWLYENNKCTYPVSVYVKENIDALRKEVENSK